MNENVVDGLVADWDDVYKKGQLSLWILLAVYDGKKYSTQITDFMYEATGGTFEVKEQSLYRALRRFSGMGLVTITEIQSPNSGPKRKYYELTAEGTMVLSKFIKLHIVPLQSTTITDLIKKVAKEGTKA